METAVNFGSCWAPRLQSIHWNTMVFGSGCGDAARTGGGRPIWRPAKSTSWRDMLRFANSSFALATQPLQYGTDITSLALNDKAATLRWLDAYLQELTDLRRQIQGGDREMIDLTLGNSLIQRERWLKGKSGQRLGGRQSIHPSISRPSAISFWGWPRRQVEAGRS